MKCRFYHIEKYQQWHKRTDSFETFKAARIKDEKSGQTVLYPMSNTDGNSVFIYGQGWKKVNKKNIIDVPYFSGNVEDWDNYIGHYGKRCLFFSLTGEDLNSQDAAVWMARKEFDAIDDIRKHTEFMVKLHELQEVQTPILESYKDRVNYSLYLVKDNLIEPSYDLGGKIGDGSFEDHLASHIIISAHVDPMADELKMRSLYYQMRMKELHPDTDTLFDTSKEVRAELRNDKLWPVSVEDQMMKLYGPKVTSLYKELLELPL